MTRKYFPKTYTPTSTKPQLKSRSFSKLNISSKKFKCRNIRTEFDIIMREKNIIVNDDQLNLYWNMVSTNILKDPFITLEEHINNLHL